MRKVRLDRLFGMVLATAGLGARGLSCGPCPPTYTDVVPILPPSSDGGLGGAGGAGGGGAGGVGGDALDALCSRYCGDYALNCELTSIELETGTMPAVRCTQQNECGAGRRPDGLEAAAFEDDAATPAGWLARAAFLEAASVDAFRALRRDLRALGAPRRLQRAASRAARDERRHARRMQAAARRFGASAPAPRVRPGAAPTLEALATENAAEGCVRETFGALVARVQAGAAADRELGAAFARIAGEEARHAALAWQIDAWARRRLDPAARARVSAARDAAARDLACAAAAPVPADLVRLLGVPDAPLSARLARCMITALGCGAAPPGREEHA